MNARIDWPKLAATLILIAALAGALGYLTAGAVRAAWMAEVGFSLALLIWWAANYVATRNEENGKPSTALIRRLSARHRNGA